jgi:hypothetical protein
LRSEIKLKMPNWLLQASAIVSVLSMGALIVIQLLRDFETLRTESLTERIANHSLTSIELVVVWAIVGSVLYGIARWRSG